MEYQQALRLIREIELRLAFLGVDLDELLPDTERTAVRAQASLPGRRAASGRRERHRRGRGHR